MKHIFDVNEDLLMFIIYADTYLDLKIYPVTNGVYWKLF